MPLGTKMGNFQRSGNLAKHNSVIASHIHSKSESLYEILQHNSRNFISPVSN